MTHCLSFFAHLNQCAEFRHEDIIPTVDGIKGFYVDKQDGQRYEIVARPVETTLKCRLCKVERPEKEIVENGGDCSFCMLQNER